MGIMIPVVRALLREHKRRPLTGRGLLIGRQTVPLTIQEARELLAEEGIDCINDQPALDTFTRFGRDRGFVSDIGFFSMFCDVLWRTLDVTDYEGAEIVHDMHEPVPSELAGQFDFIWTGSCLDNMFDPATAMKSSARMLAPGGRVVCMEMSSAHFDAYTMYSQAWFFDYFAVNGFAECAVYSCVFDPEDIWDGPYNVYAPTGYDSASQHFSLKGHPGKALITLAFAERGEESTWDRMPIQYPYRPDHEVYRAAFERFGPGPLVAAGAERRGFAFAGTLAPIPGRRLAVERRPVSMKKRIKRTYRAFCGRSAL